MESGSLIPPTSHLPLVCTFLCLLGSWAPAPPQSPRPPGHHGKCRHPDGSERASVSPSTAGLQGMQSEGANPLSLHLLGDFEVWDREKSPGLEEAGQQGELSLQFLNGKGLSQLPPTPPQGHLGGKAFLPVGHGHGAPAMTAPHTDALSTQTGQVKVLLCNPQ